MTAGAFRIRVGRICIAALATFVIGFTPCAGSAADGPPWPAAVIAVPNAPVQIDACIATSQAGPFADSNVDFTNRTDRPLIAYEVRMQYFDHAGRLIGGATWYGRHEKQPLAPGDETSDSGELLVNGMFGRAVGRQTCRILAAHFAGGKNWAYGEGWKGRLRPIRTDAATSAVSTPAHDRPAKARFKTEVANSWNDTQGTSLIVHDTVVIHGGDADAPVRPSDFALIMALPNGATKIYDALAQPAPSYAKTTLGSKATTAYEVAPSEDLGALGSIVVPAHGTVTITATFVIPDAVADPTANRMVLVR